MFEVFLLWFLLSIVAGIVAGAKGRSGMGYFLLSLVLSPLIGLLLAALLPRVDAAAAATAEPTRRCPECAEVVLLAAKKCKHCGADLPPVPVEVKPPPSAAKEASGNLLIALTALVVLGLMAKACSS